MQRLLALNPSSTPVRTYTLDGRYLLYADDAAIHRLRLPRRGSTAPPANDDFERAATIPGELNRFTTARIGHATRQRGEPGEKRFQRTVWYRFIAATSGTLQITAQLESSVFAGSSLSDLVDIGQPEEHGGPDRFTVQAGREYWIQLASAGPYPSYQPFPFALVPGPGQPGR
jgi:hypothetical protein